MSLKTRKIAYEKIYTKSDVMTFTETLNTHLIPDKTTFKVRKKHNCLLVLFLELVIHNSHSLTPSDNRYALP